MLLKLSREGIEDLSVEIARGAIMLEDLNDAASLSNIWIPDNLLFKSFGAQLLDIGLLLHLLTLVEMMELTINEFVDELGQVFADLVEIDDLTVL